MLKYCDGVPLAIVVLGGLLLRRQTVGEWETLHNNFNRYINENNILNQKDSKGLSVMWVIGLSYDDLPYFLKPCFLIYRPFSSGFCY